MLRASETKVLDDTQENVHSLNLIGFFFILKSKSLYEEPKSYHNKVSRIKIKWILHELKSSRLQENFEFPFLFLRVWHTHSKRTALPLAHTRRGRTSWKIKIKKSPFQSSSKQARKKEEKRERDYPPPSCTVNRECD